MGQSYFSAYPSASIILHPAPIITGCAEWPGQERTFHDFPAAHASTGWVSSALGQPAVELQVWSLGGAHSSFLSPQAAPRFRKSGLGTAGPSACSGTFHAICLLWDICCVDAACSLAASNNFGCNFLLFGAWGCRLAAVGRGGLQIAVAAPESRWFRRCSRSQVNCWGSDAPCEPGRAASHSSGFSAYTLESIYDVN